MSVSLTDNLLDRFHLSRAEFERKHLATLTALGLPVQVEIFNQSMREMDDFERLKIRKMPIRLQRLQSRKTPKPRRATE